VLVFNTIVWATDGSEHADQALAVAKTLARENDAALVAVHIVQRYATKTGLAVYADEGIVKTKLEDTVEQLSKDGYKASLRIINHIGPQPAHAIADVAREMGAGLIVMGTRGHGSISGLLLGSVVQRLLHIAPCPVLAVPAADSPSATN
jgi:nucleotide-binding universal stress UspA family protein